MAQLRNLVELELTINPHFRLKTSHSPDGFVASLILIPGVKFNLNGCGSFNPAAPLKSKCRCAALLVSVTACTSVIGSLNGRFIYFILASVFFIFFFLNVWILKTATFYVIFYFIVLIFSARITKIRTLNISNSFKLSCHIHIELENTSHIFVLKYFMTSHRTFSIP